MVLVATTGVLANSAAYAYPSRSGNCAVCHSIPGPSDQTGDFEIKSAVGDITDSFSVEAGGATEFLFEYTSLVEDALNPGTTRRAYLAIDGLDLLSVDQGTAFGPRLLERLDREQDVHADGPTGGGSRGDLRA